ncbi:MAG: hypothetical protein ABIL58_10450 [Pseudomonadota bacterium]
MNRKEAIKLIEQRYEEGKSRKEIFEELFLHVKYKSDLMQYIALVPSKDSREKYKKINLLLFSLLIFISITKLLTATMLLSNISIYLLPVALVVPFITIYFSVMVWKFRGNMYRILGLLGIAGILKSISNFQFYENYTTTEWILEISLGYMPAILAIFLAYYIGFRAFPYYNFWGVLQKQKLEI